MFRNLSSKQVFKRFLSNASIYSFSFILVKGGYLLLLPLYLSLLSASEFGIIGLGQAVISLILPLFEMGFHGGVLRLYYKWEEKERPKYLAAIWLTQCLVALVIFTLFAWSGEWVFSKLFSKLSFDPFGYLLLGTVFFMSQQQVTCGLFRVREQLKLFTLFNFITFAIQHGISLFLLIEYKWGVVCFFWGMVIGQGVLAVLCSFVFIYESQFKNLKKKHFSEMWKYSYPLLASGLLEGFNGAADRIALGMFVPLEQLGLYTVGRYFGLVINMFNTIMTSSSTPLIYRLVSERKDTPQLLGKFSMTHMGLMLISALALIVFAREFVMIFGGEEYFLAHKYIPYFVVGFFILSINAVWGRGLDLALKTQYYPLVSAVGFLANISLILLLIPHFGVLGAALAFVGGMLIKHGLEIALSVRFYPRPIDWLGTFFSLTIAIACMLLSDYLTMDMSLPLALFLKITIFTVSSLCIVFFIWRSWIKTLLIPPQNV